MRVLAFLLAWLPLLAFAKWDIDEIAAIRSSTVILRNTNGVVVAKIPVAHAQTLVEIKRRLVEASGIYFSIVVVEGTSPNAFVSNGLGRNVVAVNLGMLNVYGNDADVLAAVVGHEIGHIAKRHLDEKTTREVILDIVGLIVGISLDYGINKHTGVSVPIGQVISAIGGTMISRKFDRDQEHEADELAVRWMHTAGYDTTGAIRLMQNLFSSSLDFFATHPTSEDRVANVRRHVAALVPRSTIVARVSSRAELPRTGLDGGAIAELRARADDPNDPIALGLEAYTQGRHPEAFRYAGLAAEKQDPRGQLALGYCYLLGIGTSKDAPEAARWFKLAAAQQSATALTMLGIMHANGQGTPVDLEAAIRYFQQAADANYPPAIARLAAVKLQGSAKSRDLAGGISLAIRAAEYNDPLGLYLLGVSLVNGVGIPVDQKVGMTSLAKAASLGYTNADVAIGEIYLYGRGRPQSVSTAISTFSNAAEKGNPSAKAYLGLLRTDGTGLGKDYVQARKLFEEAFPQGAPLAAFGLGYLYSNGYGVSVDKARALAYFSLAVDRGLSTAASARDALQSNISAQELTRSKEIERELASQLTR